MKVLVLGSGRMGRAAAFDLLRTPEVTDVVLADRERTALLEASAEIRQGTGRSPRTMPVRVPDDPRLVSVLDECDACLSAVPYSYNPALARAAVESGTHFCDLGGNNTAVERTLRLHDRAQEKGVSVIPDCGLAPGMANIVAARAIDLLGDGPIEKLQIRVGGLPVDPQPPLDYALFFSVKGLINEYIEPCRILRDGRVQEVAGMSELESLSFPPPFEKLEAFQTSGGTSTMPTTFLGRVRDLDYKTIRYPGHAEKIRLLIQLGLTDSTPIETDLRVKVAPRQVLEAQLVNHLTAAGEVEDVVLVRVEAEAERDGVPRRYRAELICRPDEWRRTAMMRTTSDPTAVIARMMARGQIAAGAGTPETMVPPGPFLAELAERDIRFTETLDGQSIALPHGETSGRQG